MKTLPVSELVEDLDFYPRFQVDDQHVRELAVAVEAGCKLPPIVVDKKSKRIVDGIHRRRAYERVHGADHRVEVIERTYKNDAEMFFDAGRLNAAHGRRLVSCDYARFVQRAKQLGVDDMHAVAKVLNITTEKLESVIEHRFSAGPIESVRVTPLKRTIEHMAGRKLTDGQVEANRHLSGQDPSFYANQLILLLENDLIDSGNGRLLARLKKLHELLEPVVAAVSA